MISDMSAELPDIIHLSCLILANTYVYTGKCIEIFCSQVVKLNIENNLLIQSFVKTD